MSHPSTFVYPDPSPAKTEKLLKNALEVLNLQLHIASSTGGLLHHLLEGENNYLKNQHYPQGDRIDPVSGAQYFYHCHREDFQSQEHGHFHLFLRYPNIPSRIQPAALPDWDRYIDNPMTHLVSISLNLLGQPIRLFTVNRWVSQEIWYAPQHLASFLRQYKLQIHDSPYWSPVDAWVENMVQLFTPQILWLHQARERKITEWRKQYPQSNPYEDESLEELSEIQIDLPKQIEWLQTRRRESSFRRKTPKPGEKPKRPKHLPGLGVHQQAV